MIIGHIAEDVMLIHPGALFQLCLQVLVATADHDQLRVERLGIKRCHRLVNGAHAFAAGDQQHGGQIRMESEFRARRFFCRHGINEVRIDRQAGDLHLGGRHAQPQAPTVGRFCRHEAMIDARIVPERRRRDQIGDNGQNGGRSSSVRKARNVGLPITECVQTATSAGCSATIRRKILRLLR